MTSIGGFSEQEPVPVEELRGASPTVSKDGKYHVGTETEGKGHFIRVDEPSSPRVIAAKVVKKTDDVAARVTRVIKDSPDIELQEVMVSLEE